MAQEVSQVAGVVVTNLSSMRKRILSFVCVITLATQVCQVRAGVLPEERADLLFHSYDGGGVQVNGPSLLVRKNTSTNTSVFYNYYVDHITSASLDVLIGGSKYNEERTEQSVGVDYLHGKTTTSLSYTNSAENDYNAGTFSFNISQDFFGDLSTLSIGYSQGNDTVGKLNDVDQATINRQSYRMGLSQVVSKNLILGFGWETITDEGTSIGTSTVTLNNPYRAYSYCSDNPCTSTSSRAFEPEKYPRTRTSNALAIRGSYFLAYRAALHGEVKLFQDSWGVDGLTYEIGYTHPKVDWTFDFRARWYDQTKADFYRDLFDYADQFEFMARDKELSTFQSMALGVTASKEFAKGGWGWIDKGSLNVSWDHIEFSYDNYRDATAGGAAGTEPLYSFGADVFQFFVSFWY